MHDEHGKVHECRAHLLEVGLLIGEIRKDPGYPQPVWHLTIPDLWEINTLWAKANANLEQKLVHKTLQLAKLAQQRKSLQKSKYLQLSEEPAVSTRGKTVHPVKIVPKSHSPHEKGHSPHEKGPTPGERSLLYIDSIDQGLNSTVETTTTIQDLDRAFHAPTGGGGGGGLTSISEATVKVAATNSNSESLPILLRSFSQEYQLLTMRNFSSEVIDKLPQAWWGKEQYLDTLSVTSLYRLCTWLHIWCLLQATHHGGLYDPTAWDDYKTVLELYQQLYANINNLPAIIKVRVKEADAPMHDYDQQQLVQILATQMEELTHATR